MVGGPSLGLGSWRTKGSSSSHDREEQAIASRLPRTPAADRWQDKKTQSLSCPGSPATFQILNNVSGSLRPGLSTCDRLFSLRQLRLLCSQKNLSHRGWGTRKREKGVSGGLEGLSASGNFLWLCTRLVPLFAYPTPQLCPHLVI